MRRRQQHADGEACVFLLGFRFSFCPFSFD
jgi:hypothetical protein